MTAPVILVDADACPVKDECVRVALRHDAPVTFVANQGFRLPRVPLVRQRIVGDAFDAADDWIAEAVEAAEAASVVVTADILLADRCLKAGARVLSPTGRPFTPDSIGAAVAQRAIMADLRGSGDQVGPGAPPYSKADRARFVQALDAMMVAARR